MITRDQSSKSLAGQAWPRSQEAKTHWGWRKRTRGFTRRASRRLESSLRASGNEFSALFPKNFTNRSWISFTWKNTVLLAWQKYLFFNFFLSFFQPSLEILRICLREPTVREVQGHTLQVFTDLLRVPLHLSSNFSS